MIEDADRPPLAGEGVLRSRTARHLLAALRSRAARTAFLVVMVGLLVLTLVDQGPKFWHDVRALPLWIVGLALLANVAAYVGSMLVWRAGLRILGSRLSFPQAWRVFFIGQLGKYVPGSVWPVLAQIELSAAEGVPRIRGAMSIGLSIGVILSTGAIVGGIALPFVLSGSAIQWVVAGLVTTGAVIVFTPSVTTRLVNFALRLARQPHLDRPIALRDVVETVGAASLNWLAAGLMTYLLVGPVAGHGAELLVTSLAAYAIAWIAGYLFVVAPAGAGVREAVMVGVLATHVTTSAALTVALVSRALSVVTDGVTAAGAAALVGRKTLRAVRSRAHPRPDSLD